MREKIKLESTAGTGHFYTTTKNKRTTPDKLEIHEVRSRGAQARGVQGNEAEVGARRVPENKGPRFGGLLSVRGTRVATPRCRRAPQRPANPLPDRQFPRSVLRAARR